MENDVLICFDGYTGEFLRRLREIVESKSPSSCSNIAEICTIYIPGDFYISSSKMKDAEHGIVEWARGRLGFPEPRFDFEKGFWRTMQVVITDAGREALLKNEEEKLRELRKRCGRKFLVWEVGGGGSVAEGAKRVLESW
jgi:hypothetical protein